MSVQVIPSTPVAQETPAEEVPAVGARAAVQPVSTDRLVESELLVEDVSIDGMCGVY
jgi:mycofactocin precursor